MKPAKFDYLSAAAVSDVAAELAAGQEATHGETKLIAGAQSLGPMLNLRLARPAKLIDVSMLPDLRTARATDAAIEIGASVTHAEIEDGDIAGVSESVIAAPPVSWLRDAAANIAHRAVRNRGTLGGSLAHADPAADWIIVMTGLAASVVVDGVDGRREITMDAFVTGPFETALGAGDLIAAVRVPWPAEGARWGYWKFVRQVGEFAKASATVLSAPGAAPPRVAVGALGRQPLLVEPNAAADFVAGRTTARAILATALPDRPAGEVALHAAALDNALAKANDQASEPSAP